MKSTTRHVGKKKEPLPAASRRQFCKSQDGMKTITRPCSHYCLRLDVSPSVDQTKWSIDRTGTRTPHTLKIAFSSVCSARLGQSSSLTSIRVRFSGPMLVSASLFLVYYLSSQYQRCLYDLRIMNCLVPSLWQ